MLYALSIVVFAAAATETAVAAPREAVLYNFNVYADGETPVGALVQGGSGEFYGVTQSGGASGLGTVYRMSPPAPGQTQWTHTVIHSFRGGVDGANPTGSLVLGANGALFGPTFAAAGGNGRGGVFELVPPAAGQT